MRTRSTVSADNRGTRARRCRPTVRERPSGPRAVRTAERSASGTVTVKGTSARVRAGTLTSERARTTRAPVADSRTVTGSPPRFVTDTVSSTTAPGAPSA